MFCQLPVQYGVGGDKVVETLSVGVSSFSAAGKSVKLSSVSVVVLSVVVVVVVLILSGGILQ